MTRFAKAALAVALSFACLPASAQVIAPQQRVPTSDPNIDQICDVLPGTATPVCSRQLDKAAGLIKILPSALPNPTTTTPGGAYAAQAGAHQFGTGISIFGLPTFAQPVVSDVVGAVAASNNLSDLANVATARANLGAVNKAGDTMTGPLVGTTQTLGSTIYTSVAGVPTTDPTTVLGTLNLNVGSINANTALFTSYNNVAPGTLAFPVALTGHGELHSAGGQVFPFYGEAKGYSTGVYTNEFDSFNNSGANAPSTYPFNRAFGTTQSLGINLTCGAGGTNIDAACMEIVREGSTNSRFQFGIAQQAGSVINAGMYQDATATLSPAYNLILKNSGQGSNVSAIFQTMGATLPGHPVLQILNAAGAQVYGANEEGSVNASSYMTVTDAAAPDFRWFDSGAGVNQTTWSAYGDTSGTFHIRTLNDAGNAATDALAISRTGAVPTLLIANEPIQLKAYTVATLPTCNAAQKNAYAAVTDATSPTYNGVLTGGGAVDVPVVCNGSSWTAH